MLLLWLLLSVVALSPSFRDRDLDRSRLLRVMDVLLLEVLLLALLPAGEFVSRPRPMLAVPPATATEVIEFSFFPDKLSASLSAPLPQCFSCVRRCNSDGNPPAPHLPQEAALWLRFVVFVFACCPTCSPPGLVIFPPDPLVKLPDQPPTTSMSVSVVAAMPLVLSIVVVCGGILWLSVQAHLVRKNLNETIRDGKVHFA